MSTNIVERFEKLSQIKDPEHLDKLEMWLLAKRNWEIVKHFAEDSCHLWNEASSTCQDEETQREIYKNVYQMNFIDMNDLNPNFNHTFDKTDIKKIKKSWELAQQLLKVTSASILEASLAVSPKVRKF